MWEWEFHFLDLFSVYTHVLADLIILVVLIHWWLLYTDSYSIYISSQTTPLSSRLFPFHSFPLECSMALTFKAKKLLDLPSPHPHSNFTFLTVFFISEKVHSFRVPPPMYPIPRHQFLSSPTWTRPVGFIFKVYPWRYLQCCYPSPSHHSYLDSCNCLLPGLSVSTLIPCVLNMEAYDLYICKSDHVPFWGLSSSFSSHGEEITPLIQPLSDPALPSSLRCFSSAFCTIG